MHDIEFTGERVVPGKVDAELFLEHASRYVYSGRWVEGREVLDFGCGTGYGASILHQAGAARVIGADCSIHAVLYARDHYSSRSVRFCVADCEASSFPDHRFDVVVSFELIEHVRSYRRFLAEVRRILRQDGVFVVSTPNKRTYRTAVGTPPNPYHVHEFDLTEFRDALGEVFPAVFMLGQTRTEGVLFYRGAAGHERQLRLTGGEPRIDPVASASYLLAICGADGSSCRVEEVDCFQVAETNAVRSRELRILQLQGELEERSRWAEDLDEESTRRGQRVIELQNELETRTRWVKTLERETESRASCIDLLHAESEERSKLATRLDEERERSARRIVSVERELEVLSGTVERAVDGEQRVMGRVLDVGRELRAELTRLRDAQAHHRGREKELAEAVRWQGDSLVWQRQLLERLETSVYTASRDSRELRSSLDEWSERFRDVERAAQRAQTLVGMLWRSRSWRFYAVVKRFFDTVTLRGAVVRQDRGGAELADRRRDPVESGAAVAMRRPSRRALIIDHRLPTPDQDAGSVRMIELIRLLRSFGFSITFLPENMQAVAPYGKQLETLDVEVVVVPRYSSPGDYLAVHGEELDLVLVSRFHIAVSCIDHVRELCPAAKVIFDTVDLQHLRLKRQAKVENDPTLCVRAERTRAAELSVAARADATLVVSEVEEALLRREAPNLRVHCVSLVEKVHDEIPGYEEREGFYFVGGFEHPPNVDAVQWFMAEVLPLVRQTLPSVPFFVIGSKAPESICSLAEGGVEVCGYVEGMERYLAGCRLSIAPLRYGAGIKGKVTQSMAWGLPCVMTSVAAEGIGLVHRVDAMVADEPADFAASIVELYHDRELWERMSVAGRQRIHEGFSVLAARCSVLALLEQLERVPNPLAETAVEMKRE